MGKIIYEEGFKKTIVELLNSGKTVKELTSEFGISQASIHRWRKEYSASTKSNESESSKIKALEKELKNVKLERDILKKAVSIFSKRNN